MHKHSPNCKGSPDLAVVDGWFESDTYKAFATFLLNYRYGDRQHGDLDVMLQGVDINAWTYYFSVLWQWEHLNDLTPCKCFKCWRAFDPNFQLFLEPVFKG